MKGHPKKGCNLKCWCRNEIAIRSMNDHLIDPNLHIEKATAAI